MKTKRSVDIFLCSSMNNWKKQLRRNGGSICFQSDLLFKHTVTAQSFLTSRLFSHSITPDLFIHYSSHSLLLPSCTMAAATAPLWSLSCGFQNQMPDTMVTLTQVIWSPVPLLFIDSWNIFDSRCLQVKTCAGVSSVKERRKCHSKIQYQYSHLFINEFSTSTDVKRMADTFSCRNPFYKKTNTE